MSGFTVIRFENVSKRYRRGFRTLRHLVQETSNRLLGRNDRFTPSERYRWALKDVSFEVRRGEILGVVGANGAGKSTVLKLASRITYPTHGNIEVKGRVGTLIEAGAGFHPELTGKENVYLNAKIFGMNRDELKAKYDSIVEFAELDDFMDMPLKYYSSGMHVRLGFSVAAHQEPDVFLIDEVLSVGDAGFQIKCENRIRELKESGTTILLVSHNMTNITLHCDRAIWLDKGSVAERGEPAVVTDAYLESVRTRTQAEAAVSRSRTYSDGVVSIESVSITTGEGTETAEFQTGDIAHVHISYHAADPVGHPVFSVDVLEECGRFLGKITSKYADAQIDSLVGRGTITLQFDPLIMLKGHYYIHVYILDGESMRFLAHHTRALSFSVNTPALADELGAGAIGFPHKWIMGV